MAETFGRAPLCSEASAARSAWQTSVKSSTRTDTWPGLASRDGSDFINFLEDETDSLDWERLATNLFLDFLSVVLPASSHDSQALV